jgi:SulP family sulfate permease
VSGGSRAAGSGPTARLPGWLIDRVTLRDDVVAGLTVAVLLVPQGMAYAVIAGVPPITGLYAALAAILVYAVVGTSSHLGYGPVAIISLLSAAAVAPLADGDPGRLVALSALLAVMVGALHVALGALRAGLVVDLISHPVIVGFTSAAAIVIGLTQAKDLLGVEVARSDRVLDAARDIAGVVGDAHPATVTVGAAAVLALVGLRRFAPRLPGSLVVALAGVVAALGVGLEERGVRLVGAIPAGLPRPSLPAVAAGDAAALLPAAGLIALISFAETISIGKAIAGRTREPLDANRELLASGAANTAAGLLGGFAVAGSFSRSFLLYRSGARSRRAGLISGLVLALVLALLTRLLEPLPRAVLAAIVVVTVAGLVDVREARRVLAVDRRDGAVLVATFVATLVLGVELGLAVGVGLNIAVHVARGMRPALVEVARLPGTRVFRNHDVQPGITAAPDGLILRLDGPLDFLSARTTVEGVRAAVRARPGLRWLVLDCGAVSGLDSTGLHALVELRTELVAAEVRFLLAKLRGPQREVIERAGLAPELLRETLHATVDEALEAAGVPAEHPLRVPAPGEQRPPELY